MGNERSDDELLERFVGRGDEEAFRLLVGRYSGLVFHTAFRTLNDRTLAEDVGQRVFAALAKKAAQVARGTAPLPSWLHRTTVLEAKCVRRSESRHQRKKEVLMTIPAEPREACDDTWRDALPHLDAAIDALPESDRHVLLLHFVNELTFPEIAGRVGRSAAAVQKQSRRALERLQGVLRHKGVALSLGVLTAGLTAEMAKASPVILVPALGGLTAKTTPGLFVVKKTTVAALSATALLCGVPLARQQAEIHRLEARIANATPLAEFRTSSRAAGARDMAGVSFLKRLARDLRAQNSDVPRYVGAIDHLDSLSNDELIALARETAAGSLDLLDQETIIGALFRPLAQRDPELALNTLLEQIPEPCRSQSSRVMNLMEGILRDLSEKHPDAALAWFERNLGAIRLIPLQEGLPEGIREYELRKSLSYGLILNRPEEAIRILKPVPEDSLKSHFWQYVNSREPSLRGDVRGYIAVARGVLSEREAGIAIARLAEVHRSGWDPSKPFTRSENVLETHDLTPSEADAVMVSAGASRLYEASRKSSDELTSEIVRFRSWLQSQTDGRADRLAGRTLAYVVSGWGDDDKRIVNVFADRSANGLTDEAMAGFLNELEHHPNSSIDLESLDRIAASAAGSEEVRTILERIHSKYRR